MTQEDKELLLKDLCARLPYGVKVTNGIHTITLTPCSDTSIIIKNEHILPYLRPMSSMTEEEEKEFNNQIYKAKPYSDGKSYNVYEVTSLNIDWLNAHHFDYRGLIPMGLAIEVTKENNPYKE